MALKSAWESESIPDREKSAKLHPSGQEKRVQRKKGTKEKPRGGNRHRSRNSTKPRRAQRTNEGSKQRGFREEEYKARSTAKMHFTKTWVPCLIFLKRLWWVLWAGIRGVNWLNCFVRFNGLGVGCHGKISVFQIMRTYVYCHHLNLKYLKIFSLV